MKLVESIMTKNPCYTAGRKITVKGLMLHSVGCAQPKASVFINNWNKPSYGNACVHGFIDGNDGTVYQTLPWNHRGWHCASGPKGSGNNTHIGVEMCEPASIRYTGGASFTCSNLADARASAKRTYEAAVELFAYLCKKYGLNPTADGVIISHREGHSRGIASNHGDPEHLWRGLGLGYTMNTFRAAVKAKMDGGSNSIDYGAEIKKKSGYVQIIYKGSDGVNIRTAPNMGNNVARTVRGGTFKVVGMTMNGEWYQLESGEFITTRTDLVKFFESKPVAGNENKVPFKVKVDIPDLRIRKAPGTDQARTGKYTGKGIFTIVEVNQGKVQQKAGEN